MDYSKLSTTELTEELNSIKKRELFLKELLKESSDLTIVLNSEESITFVSPSIKKVTKFESSDLIGKHPADFLHKEDYSNVMSSIEAAVLEPNKVIGPVKFRSIDKDGNYLNFEAWMHSALNNRDINGIICNLKQTVEQETAKKEVENIERQLELLFNTLPNPVFECSLQGQLLHYNDKFPIFVGYSKKEISKLKIWDLIENEEEKAELPNYLEHLISTTGTPEPYNTVFKTSAGENLNVRIDWNFRYDDIITEMVFSGIITNTTEKIIAENKLKTSLEKIKLRNEELKSFGFLVTHDLRSPLVNIEGFSGELKLDCKNLLEVLNSIEISPEDKEKLIPLIEENIPISLKFISQGIREMFTVLKGIHELTEVTRIAIHRENIDMNKVVKAVKTDFVLNSNHDDVIFHVDELPGCIADLSQVKQILSHLIENAIKFKKPDQKTEIRVSGKTEGIYSIYSVSDNGRGVEKEYQRKIFHAFQQLEPDSTEGDGLGLPLVVRMLERNDGSVWMDSTPDEGSTVFFSLPNVEE